MRIRKILSLPACQNLARDMAKSDGSRATLLRMWSSRDIAVAAFRVSAPDADPVKVYVGVDRVTGATALTDESAVADMKAH